jgi:energy-coupling factor transporter ATP-binding protein EcfA2
MRIRSILFHDFRSFRGKRVISFVDPITDLVRPVNVLAGSNGSGKTTLLDAIEALLAFILEPDIPSPLIDEALDASLICMELELAPEEILNGAGQPPRLIDDRTARTLHIAVGKRTLAPPSPDREWPNLYCRFVQRGVQGKPYERRSPLAERLRKAVSSMQQGKVDLHGGLIYFPHVRTFDFARGGPITPVREPSQWRYRFTESDRWEGSLEELWVWQNYLDLEQGTADHANLKPFVNSVESVFGKNRKVAIKEGRVLVPTSWHDEAGNTGWVRIEQLPSGEAQTLVLFGELTRRRRPGAIIGIDEVENSLHPTLQRLVMWNLQRMASEWDAQVIVSTHSLEVINFVRGGAFINLDFPEDRFNLPLNGSGEAAS